MGGRSESPPNNALPSALANPLASRRISGPLGEPRDVILESCGNWPRTSTRLRANASRNGSSAKNVVSRPAVLFLRLLVFSFWKALDRTCRYVLVYDAKAKQSQSITYDI
jgi:hypothetical protein